MKFRLIPASVLSGVALLSTPVLADDHIDYTYIEGAYVIQDVDIYEDSDTLSEFLDETQDGDGFEIKGSIGLGPNWFAYTGYSQSKLDFDITSNEGDYFPAEVDVKQFHIGAGYIIPLYPNLNMQFSAAYVDQDLSEFSLGASDQDILDDDTDLGDVIDDLNDDSSDGYWLDAGLRGQVNPWLELGGGLRYTELDVGDSVSVFGNALWEITPTFGLNLAIDLGDEVNEYSLGARATF